MAYGSLYLSRGCWGRAWTNCQRYQAYSAIASPKTSPLAPRHLLSIADLNSKELAILVQNAAAHKASMKSGVTPAGIKNALIGKTVAMLFSKRSTRTRLSTEGAVVAMGGHPIFLGKDDIQLGVNESLYDSSIVISSMVSCIVARVGPHSDIANLANTSTAPVINALCDSYHPLQAITDFLTIHETFSPHRKSGLGLDGLKIAWIGDANNVLYDICIGARKLGIDVAVATPEGYEIPRSMRERIERAGAEVRNPGTISETTIPEEAVKDADIIATDTWISMGQEAEKKERLDAFKRFQVTTELARKGGAKANWRFMHCLPRHPEEVTDEVFYGPNAIVFSEAENRLWAAISTIEAFVVNQGKIS